MQTGGRCNAAGVVARQFLQIARAVRESIAGGYALLPLVGREAGVRVLETQGDQQPFANICLVRLARFCRDDFTDEREAEVGVLEVARGGIQGRLSAQLIPDSRLGREGKVGPHPVGRV